MPASCQYRYDDRRKLPLVVQDFTAPVSITVIAVDVAVGADPADTKAAFERSVELLADLGAVNVDPGGAAVTVALDPDVELNGAVSRLGGILSDFEERCPAARMRALLHFGTAFRARDTDGRDCFQGSALRSVANSLKRSTLIAGMFATPDFVSYVASFKTSPGFELLSAGSDGYQSVMPGERRKPATNEIHSTDPTLVEWLKARLARDLGPFASPLVDNASHSTRTAKELAAAVGHEIVNSDARQRFDADVFRYLKARER